MPLFTDEIDNRIKELQEMKEYKGRKKGSCNNQKIANAINAEFGTNYSAEQIRDHRHKVINGYFQSSGGIASRQKTNSKIATKIYTNLVELAKTKYGREVLGLNQKETRAYLKENQLSIDHIEPIKMRYIENLCCWFGYRWKYWSDVPKHIQEKLKNMFNQIDNLQLIPISENIAKRDFSNRTRHY